MAHFKLYLFGAPRLERDDEIIEIRLRKALALLVYLAVTRVPQSRDVLAGLLWPESSQKSARGSLRRTLHALKETVGEEIVSGSEVLALSPESEIWVDVLAFQEAAERLRDGESDPGCLQHLERAATLYRDDFLAGFTLPDSPGWDEWQFFEHEGLQRVLAEVLVRLIAEHESRGEWEAALSYARRWLALDPLHEPAHRTLMKLYALNGQQAAALRQYEECTRLLDEELGAPPEEETTGLYEQIRRREIAPTEESGPAARPEAGEVPRPAPAHPAAPAGPPAAPTRPPLSLPPQPTPFIGREQEVADILRRLGDPACRLLTLVGPGGIGKTRLAIEVAEQLAAHPPEGREFPDGIFFVPLVAAASMDDVVTSVAESIGLRLLGRESPMEQLLDYLSSREMLLLLDSVEHLLHEEGTSLARLVEELLSGTTGVSLLVTSREALNLVEEWLHTVDGMRVPPHDPFPTPEAAPKPLQLYDAVRLFESCARRARLDFVLAAEEGSVVRICRLVEGRPLAIEMAASWLQVLPAETVADEIEQSLDILTTRHRNVPRRQRSMRVVMEHSWALLDEREQQVMNRLCVFRGGFDRVAAEEVAGASLHLLAALADKSLIRSDSAGRYYIHELTRQFAAEQLTAEESSEVEARHSDYFLRLVAQQESTLHGSHPSRATDALKKDIDNIRHALHRATARGRPEALAGAIDALATFYELVGLLSEGEEIFGEIAAMLAHLPATTEMVALRALSLARQAHFAAYRGRTETAAEIIAQMSALVEGGLPERCRADLAYTHGHLLSLTGDFDDAILLLREAARRYETLGRRREMSLVLGRLGETEARQHRIEASLVHIRRGLQVSEELGDVRTQALCLSYLAQVTYFRDDHRAALGYFKASLARFEQAGDVVGTARTTANVGFTYHTLGEVESALHHTERAIALSGQLGLRSAQASALDTLGALYIDMGDYDAAREALLRARHLIERMNLALESGWVHNNLGRLDMALEEYGHAEANFRKALSRMEEVGSPREQGVTLIYLGRLYRRMGRPDEARQSLERAIALLNVAESPKQLEEARAEMSRILEEGIPA